MYSTRYSCEILLKLEFSLQIFEKYSKPNFVKIRPVGAELLPADGQTDKHFKSYNCFSQFWEGAKKVNVQTRQKHSTVL